MSAMISSVVGAALGADTSPVVGADTSPAVDANESKTPSPELLYDAPMQGGRIIQGPNGCIQQFYGERAVLIKPRELIYFGKTDDGTVISRSFPVEDWMAMFGCCMCQGVPDDPPAIGESGVFFVEDNQIKFITPCCKEKVASYNAFMLAADIEEENWYGAFVGSVKPFA